MPLLLRLSRLILAAALVAGCRSSPSPDDAVTNQPAPTSIAHAAALKDAGTAWTNGDVRAYYLRAVAAIGPANEGWKQEHLPAEARAHRAFEMRHDARLIARAMMKDPADVALLEQRDKAKYGTPDGPTFEWLVAHDKEKGLSGDAIYEAIVESAQRTDGYVNELFAH